MITQTRFSFVIKNIGLEDIEDIKLVIEQTLLTLTGFETKVELETDSIDQN